MAQTKVSALTEKTTPAGTEELLINDGGTSKKITIANAVKATDLPTAPSGISNDTNKEYNLKLTDVGGTETLTWVEETDNDTTYSAGSLLDLSTTTFNVDLSELTDGTDDVVGSADELVYLDASSQKRKQIDEIKLGQFNNDQSWTSNAGTMTDVVDDTSPQLGGDLDVNGNDIVSTANADIDIIPHGTGDVNLGADTVQVGDNDADATITTQGTGDLILNTNNGTNAGNITLADGANGDISITPNGTGNVVLGGDLDCNGSQIQWSQGADVASATALVVLTDGNYFDVTGTTTITSINTTGGVGTLIKLHFDDALILTHHATDLILPGGANITTAAGDEAEFIEYATGDYRCTNYSKASGEAVVSSGSFDPDGAVTINESGADVDFRVEGSGAANALFVQGSDGAVGIGTGSPAKLLHLSESADGTKLRFTRGGISEWDFSIGNTSTLTGVAAGSLELLPLNASTDFAIGKAGTTTALMHVKDTGTDIVGDVTLETGDIVFGTSGKGICLGVTSNTDSNTLSDYETGDWTVVLTGTSGGVFSYTERGATYTKIGDTVFCTFGIDVNTEDSTASGTVKLTGLPFTSKDVGAINQPRFAPLAIGLENDRSASPPFLVVSNNASDCQGVLSNNSVAVWPAGDLGTSTSIIGEFFYRTA
jgi:hypothetical protein